MKALSCHGTAGFLLKKSCLALLVGIALSSSVHAQQATGKAQYSVASGELTRAVNEISRSSGLQIVYNIDELRGLKSGEVTGTLTVQQALDKALRGSGLSWTQVSPTTISIQKKIPQTPRPSRDAPSQKPPATSKSTQDKAEGVHGLDSVVVVGSRLGVSLVDSAMPIQVITREQIDRSGSGNIAQVLSYLSEVSVNSNGDRPIGVGDGLQSGGNTNATTVQMRGMPRGTTLVLINGRRAGDSATYSDSGQFDLSTIPLALVERIEVLPAGSSAIYGGDGLAGVINVVLRRDANGLELRFRQSHAKGYPARQATIMWGKTWTGTDLMIAANWGKESSLYNSERSLTADQDYRRFGGEDWRSDSSNPATVYSLAGCPAAPALCFLKMPQRGNLPGLTSPVAVIPAGSNGIGLRPEDFLATQGQENRTSRPQHLRSAEENFGLTINGRLDLSPSVESFVELSHTSRDVPAFEMPLNTFIPRYGYQYARVPASNPFNPFGVDVAVGFNFVNTGVFTTYQQEYYRGALGIRGKEKHFDWEISGWQSHDKTETGGAQYFNTAAVIAAINSTNPETALNPFISNGKPPGSLALLQSLIEPLSGKSTSKTSGLTGYLRGQPLKLPAGPITALIGLEHQRQSIDISTNNSSLVDQELNGGSKSTAYFAEARVPILSPRTDASWERMAVTGAIRRESSSRFVKDATTETVGVEIRPTQSLLLRGTYSTAFRPILNYYTILPPRSYPLQVLDPKFNGDIYDVSVRYSGGAPDDLKPESSKNSTIGLVFRPNSDWSATLTHWNLEFTDRISYVDAQSLVDEEDLRPGRVRRNPDTGVIEEVDGRQVNIALISSSGVDLGFDTSWSTQIGEFQAYLTATYTYQYEQKSTEDSPIENGLAQLSSDGWAPRWKIVPRISWERGPARAMLTGRYLSKYKDSQPFQSGPNIGVVQNLGDFWLFDLNVDVSIGRFFESGSVLSGLNLNIGANNLFNRLPEFCVGCYSAGYDASQSDILGRTLYAELRMNF